MEENGEPGGTRFKEQVEVRALSLVSQIPACLRRVVTYIQYEPQLRRHPLAVNHSSRESEWSLGGGVADSGCLG